MISSIRSITHHQFLGKSLLSLVLFLSLALSGALWNVERGMMNDERSPQDSSFSIHRSSFNPRVSQAYGQLPLSFEVNQGQVDDQVKFLARGSGYELFLTATEAVL